MQMDELACFAPGMLALGFFGYGGIEAEKYLSLAEEVLIEKYLWSVFGGASIICFFWLQILHTGISCGNIKETKQNTQTK